MNSIYHCHFRGSCFLYTVLCACCPKLLQSCLILCGPHGLQPARLLCPWDSLGRNTGVGCHALLQGIFLAQGSNPSLLCLLHWWTISLPLPPRGKPLSALPECISHWVFERELCKKHFLRTSTWEAGGIWDPRSSEF